MQQNSGKSWQRVMLRVVAPSLTLFSLVVPAAAQPESFEALVAEGIELRVQGRSTEAVAQFRSAVKLEPQSLRARGHLALSLHAVGEWLESERVMVSVLAAPEDEWVKRHMADLQQSLQAVRAHLGWLELDVPGPGRAWVDGVAIGAVPTPEPVRVVAKRCVVRIELDGRSPMTRKVEVGAGGHVRVVVSDPGVPLPLALAHRKERAVAPRSANRRGTAVAYTELRSYGFLSLGAGAAAFLTGATLGIYALVLKERRDDECDRAVCSAEGIRIDAHGRMAANLSGVLLGVGGAGLIGGGLLLWSDSRSSSSASLVVAPGVSHHAASFAITW